MTNGLNIPVPPLGGKLRRDAEVTPARRNEQALKALGWRPGKSGRRKADRRQYPEASAEGIVRVIRLPRKAS